MSATGAVPGPSSCLPVRKPPKPVNGHVAVTVSPDMLRSLLCVPDVPRLALRAGQVDWYDAVVAAGSTDASSQLPPPAQQFSPADAKG